MGDRRYRSHERLRSSHEYQLAKRMGRRIRTAHFTINLRPNDLPHHRLGMVVQKRFWHAVERNRIKRRLREWFRTHKHRIPMPGKDLVFVARPGAEIMPVDEIDREVVLKLTAQDEKV
ncbi:MAG: ribonuclease P protein component [Syntrophobacteraceae bacterium]|nr:ribonuclease P protein component [Syntrophobacteraceae bacterium]